MAVEDQRSWGGDMPTTAVMLELLVKRFRDVAENERLDDGIREKARLAAGAVDRAWIEHRDILDRQAELDAEAGGSEE